MTIQRLLVANRGEIVRRVFRTCRELGIETVAVHSDADAGLAFVAEADQAVRLPGNSPAETYLRTDRILDAARRTGADAIHPGYGFLSENAAFARAVIDAGLTWVGPPPTAMDAMATKVEAKQLMAEAGVPVLNELDPAALTEADLPVLVKASSGGGGRGMRVIRTLDQAAAVVELARNEAASAFGDPTVFCEPYVERGRHVEVQIWGDHSGTSTSVLGARDCSVQRRHQKVVEEAPPANLPAEVLQAMYDAARAAGKTIGYVGVGTVEFLYDPDTERFFFLEMNTRLQVEHPVTELVTGLDLVKLQLAAAEDPTLTEVPLDGERGHAIEVRLYAEDPAVDYQPQSGTLTRFEVPGVVAEFTNPTAYGIRLDTGVRSGDEIGTHYDAMVAKVMAWAPTRAEAARRLAAALKQARIHGLRTNRDLLVQILGHPTFLAGEATTAFLAEEDLGAGVPGTATDQGLGLFAAAVAWTEARGAQRPVQQRIPHGWRNVVSAPHRVRFELGGTELGGTECAVGWLRDRDAQGREVYAFVDDEVSGAHCREVRRTGASWEVRVEHDGVTRTFEVSISGDRVEVDAAAGHLALRALPRFTDPADQVAEGSLLAPMPGSVIAVHAAVGDQVASGQPVLVMEAMKMQHTIAAPYDGVVTELAVAVGAQVTAGDVLAVVDSNENPGGDA